MPPKLPPEKLKDLPEDIREYIGALEGYLEYIESRLRKNSRNSSVPPSQDPPSVDKKKKRRSSRRPGGQDGHLGASRPLEKPDRIEKHRPEICRTCGTVIPPDADLVGSPLIRQQRELVEKPTEVIQREYWECDCSHCGRRSRAEPLPGEELCLGPRLQATAIFLHAECHVSLAKTASFFQEVLETSVSKATLCGIRFRAGEALQHSTKMILQEVRLASEKGIDETGWKNAGVREYLWCIATNSAAFYAILPSRGRKVASGLLGDNPQGLIMTDGYIVYDFLPPELHGRCCAHLQRNFQALAESRVPIKEEFGRRGFKILATLFQIVQRAKEGLLSPWDLWETLQPVRQRMGKLLWKGRFSGDKELENFSLRLQEQWKSFFLFPERGLDATNNGAERALRPGVIWRKISMGSRTEEGTAFVGRILSVLETAVELQCPANEIYDKGASLS